MVSSTRLFSCFPSSYRCWQQVLDFRHTLCGNSACIYSKGLSYTRSPILHGLQITYRLASSHQLSVWPESSMVMPLFCDIGLQACPVRGYDSGLRVAFPKSKNILFNRMVVPTSSGTKNRALFPCIRLRRWIQIVGRDVLLGARP